MPLHQSVLGGKTAKKKGRRIGRQIAKRLNKAKTIRGETTYPKNKTRESVDIPVRKCYYNVDPMGCDCNGKPWDAPQTKECAKKVERLTTYGGKAKRGTRKMGGGRKKNCEGGTPEPPFCVMGQPLGYNLCTHHAYDTYNCIKI